MSTLDPEHFKKIVEQIVSRSNGSFEIDFRKLLKSKYVRNRVILVDTACGHVQFQHTVFPPITQTIKSVNEIPISDMIDGPSPLIQRKSNKCIIVTIRSEANRSHYIRSVRKRIYVGSGSFKTFKTKGISLYPESLNKEQLYLAVVSFKDTYMFLYTKFTYSHIDIFSIHDKKNASKLVARFEGGGELTISASS